MGIWSSEIDIEKLNTLSKGSMGEFLSIEITEIGEDFMVAKMPVDSRTKQPFGVLHGGASVVLAESVGSVGSNCIVDISKFRCVGLEINSNHLKSVSSGYVYAKATALHIGKTTHVWDIKITNEEGKLINVSRLTMAIIAY
ncbi:MAG: hotdog fold thioesterase [Bacteroidetes bacterium]|nr:MAG: hotdog fold thioesterase [Bacteroidota bacterium]TAG88382.1 MAG: hotdog fold thioesterase [Bacteroidota bacterium]